MARTVRDLRSAGGARHSVTDVRFATAGAAWPAQNGLRRVRRPQAARACSKPIKVAAPEAEVPNPSGQRRYALRPKETSKEEDSDERDRFRQHCG